MKFSPIDLFANPGHPAPLTGSRPLEFWSWGPLHLVVQRDSLTMADLAEIHQGRRQRQVGGLIEYPLSVLVCDAPLHAANPLEHVVAIVSMELSPMHRALRGGHDTPMVGMFTTGGHRNHGVYTGPVDPVAIRAACFRIIEQELHPPGEPIFEGSSRPMFQSRRGHWLEPGGFRKFFHFLRR